MFKTVWWRGLLSLGFCVGFVASALAQEALLVAGGAGYRRPIDEIAQSFEAQSGLKVERVYGHMGQVIAQARASGKVAVVFGEQDVLEKAEGLSFSQYLPLGRGRLVLAWPKSGTPLKSLADLQAEPYKRVGVADLTQAIFGKAARESLSAVGVWAQVAPRLIVVATVPQVSAYLASGEVDAGFVNLTEALGLGERIGGYIEIPAERYTPVRIAAGVVSGANAPAQQAFLDYLKTPAVRAVLQRYGL